MSKTRNERRYWKRERIKAVVVSVIVILAALFADGWVEVLL